MRCSTEVNETMEKIVRKDVMPIPFLKKERFTGSCGALRFVMQKEEDRLAVYAWKGLYCFDKTPEEEKTREEFSFDEEGLCQAVEWLNQFLE